ncbi:MAG TPA: hypothetical protein VFQ13_15230 [Anaerolineales bacterium]|nr:hypothetical protein [Anaerolineales bacterium]
MKQTVQKLFSNETFIAILIIFLTTLLTYGVSIPKLGYYRDDWYLLWSGQARGAASIIPLFSTDRPFMGVVYSFVYRLLGDTIVNWHLYALLWRFIGGLAFFWILRLLWPNHKYLTTVMTVLFIVYPGFLSIPNANTKQNHLYGFGTALLSIALMLQAMKTRSQAWKITLHLLSLILTANYLLIYEYMIGFEGTRIILLGYSLWQDGIKNVRALIREVFTRVWPYLLVTAGFLYWRIFIFDSSRNATDAGRLAENYFADLRHMSFRLILETVKDFLDTSIFAWFVTPYQLIATSRYAYLGTAVFIAGVVIVLVLLYTVIYKRMWDTDAVEKDSLLLRDFMGIGSLVILCAIVPVIFFGRNVELSDTYKSYGLHPIPGVILFVTGIILTHQPRFRKWILATLIVISVTTQLLNASDWGNFWEYQRQMWWQLTWRAPGIKDGTMVMTYSTGGYNPQQDYEVWGPINLIYRPHPAASPSIQAEVLNSDTVSRVISKQEADSLVRDFPVYRDYGNLLLISISPVSSCLHVIDGALPVYSEWEAPLTIQAGKYSQIDRIVPSGTSPVPSASIFGPEPVHDWCYYYQKASLARQIGDWEEIGTIYREVKKLKLNTSDKSEMVPFLEALVNLGDDKEAREIYKQIKGSPRTRILLCDSLAQDPGYPPEFGYDYQAIHQLVCKD